MKKAKKSYFKSDTKNFTYTKNTKSPRRAISKKNTKANINPFNFRYSNTNLKKILLIQRNWKIHYRKNIENKIIKIQSLIRGNIIRESFNEVFIMNKKLEMFFFIIKITMFRHAINYDYLASKRIDYYSDHKNTKYFLLLQRRIRYFLFIKKIKVFEKLGIFNNIYIITKEYRTKIKSKMTSDKYLAKPILKFHRPLTQIKMIQRNYLIHAKLMRKINKQKIDKLFLNKSPIITKEQRYIIEKEEDNYKNVKIKVINIKKDFYTKVNYNYHLLLIIQQRYKERYNYLKENYKLRKHSKLLKKVNNKHHYIYHCRVINSMYEVLMIQKNIKYFLYRRHSMINLLKKVRIKKCEIRKQYEARGNVKKYFYEEFARRLIIIIRRFFLLIYLKILKKNSKARKVYSFGLSDYNYINSLNSGEISPGRRKSGLSLESIKTPTQKNRQNNHQGKETFTRLSNKNIEKIKQSNLINNNEAKTYKDRHSKKKVTFKSDTKVIKKDSSKNVKQNIESMAQSPISKSLKNIRSSSKNIGKYKGNHFGNTQNSPFHKPK